MLLRISLALCALLCAVSHVSITLAHPLGNFSINSHTSIAFAADALEIVYILDRAEIPALQEKPSIDQNADGALDAAEQQAYLNGSGMRSGAAATVLQNLKIEVDGRRITPRLTAAEMSFPPGQGGLPTQRITLRLQAQAPLSNASIRFTDGNFNERLGWREIVVRTREGVAVSGNEVPTQDLSDALMRFPDALLSSPPRMLSLAFDVRVTDIAPTAESRNLRNAGQTSGVSQEDQLTALISGSELTVWTVTLACALALAWGAAHALSPGHGKTIAAAYLIGARATAKHALLLGASTAVTHTASVFALGAITLLASQTILPEQLFPFIEITAGLTVVTLGVALLLGRWRRLITRRSTEGHDDIDPQAPHDHGDGFTHRHGVPRQTVGWRGLIALGASGGLLPCPSAMIVMLSAIAMQRVAFGLLLVLIFSIGLAAVLVGIGIALIRARNVVEHLFAQPAGWRAQLFRYAPILSAIVVTAAGVAITARALLSIGVVRL